MSLQGDLGISCGIRSRSVLINFFHEIHDRECDLEMCFSDDRKIQTYEMIYKRYFTKNTEVINYLELTLSSNQMVRCDEFDKLNIENIPFEHTLGRKRDLQYINYLEANPLYKKVRYITDGKFYAVIGESESCCEILDLSSPTVEGFSWAIKATMAFSSYYKVLVRKEHFKTITSLTNSTVFYSKPINLLLGFYTNKDIDTQNLWVGRIDRR
ncbi:hypothetical protein [Grimontia marina]|nr:hypothetical protein [Grimontia marina]